jgi:hypothetical protein
MSRSTLAFATLALLLCASVAWFVRSAERAEERVALVSASAPAKESASPWLSARVGASADFESSHESAVRERSAAPAPPSAAERAASSAGVLVRVVDRAGEPLAGVPVGLRLGGMPLEHELVEPAPKTSPRVDRRFFGPRARAVAEPRGALPVLGALPILGASFQPHARTWTPPRLEPAHAPIALLARAETDVRGEALLERARESADEVWVVELLLPTSHRREQELASGPAPARRVEFELDGLRRIELAALDDGGFAPAEWRACVLAPSFVDPRAELAWRFLEEGLRVPRGTTRELLAEQSAALRIEAWVEASFGSRLSFDLEPSEDARRGRVELDARREFARLDFAVADAAGERLERQPFSLELWDGEREQVCLVESGAGGSFQLLLDARRIFPPGSTLRIALDAKSASDAHEAHLDLARGFAPGAIEDLGIVNLGSGPLLCSGVVVDEEGRLLPYALVDCEERDETFACDEQGRFERRGYARSAGFFLEPRAPGHYALEPIFVRAGARDARLVLQRGATLRGRLRLPAELPTSEVHLRYASPVTNDLMLERLAVVLPDGFFELDGLAEGWGMVTLEWDDTSIYGRGFDLALGENDAGELDLRAALERIELEVRRADGSAASAVSCSLEVQSEERVVYSDVRTCDERGRVRWWMSFLGARWTASAEQVSITGTRGGTAPRVLQLAR